MRATGPRVVAVRPTVVRATFAALGVALAGLTLAACSGAGSGGNRPTLSGSGSGSPGPSRTLEVSRTASVEAPTASEAVPPGGSVTGSAAASPEVTSAPTTQPTRTRTQPAPVPTTTTTTATVAPTSPATTSAPATTTTTTATTTTTTTTTTTAPATTTTTTVTQSPTAPAVVASPAPTASPTAPATESTTSGTSGDVPWWAWVLLLLAVAGLIAGIVVMQGRRRRAVEVWDRGLADAEDAALWLHERVLPTVLADRAPAATATAWPSARPRLLELDEQLTGLGRTPPDEERRAAVVTLRSALADVGGALDRRAAAADAQAWAAAQTQAELADERLAHVLGHAPASPGAPGYLPPGPRSAPPESADVPAAPTPPASGTPSDPGPAPTAPKPAVDDASATPGTADPGPAVPPAAPWPPDLVDGSAGAAGTQERRTGGRHAAPDE